MILTTNTAIQTTRYFYLNTLNQEKEQWQGFVDYIEILLEFENIWSELQTSALLNVLWKVCNNGGIC